MALSNPGPAAFEAFAADQLVDVIEAQVCRGELLPPLVRLALRDCPRLVQDQRHRLGVLVGQHTHRTNLGLFSVYRSDLGGGQLAGLALPRFAATVLAGAGRFVILQAGIKDGEP